ncbi:MAG TPA: TetR/AcrR family transcriptional regulator [Solimonas sp.]
MGRRNLHTREQQRDMAIAAAELILVREGIDELSMRKVAQAIGYTVGNLYLLFQNQDDLLAALNERTADAIYLSLRDRIEVLDDPRERLGAMARGYIEFATGNPNRWRLLFEHQLPEEMKPRPTADARIRRLFELVETTLAALEPKLKADALRLRATTFWGGIHGIGSLAVSGKLSWGGRSSDYTLYCEEMITAFFGPLKPRRRS